MLSQRRVGLASSANVAPHRSGPASRNICGEMCMQSYKSHAAAAFAALNAELYHAAKEDTPAGALNPFILMAGPELQRQPWLEPYFSRAMLCDIHAAMEGCETLYVQMHDLLNLLSLQFNPVTPDDQRAISQWIGQGYGLWIPEKYIVWMTERECEDAITRLTSFIASDSLARDDMQFVRWHVPFVLHTARMGHQVRDAAGQRVQTKLVMLTPRCFVLWFKERLILAVKTRLEQCPENPLWILPDGKMQGIHVATDQDYTDFVAWRKDVCQPARRGNQGRGKYSGSGQEFYETIIGLIRLANRKGMEPTETNTPSCS